MSLAKSEFKRAFKLALAGTGALLCLTPTVSAIELSKSAASVTATPHSATPIKIAQVGGCPDGQSTFVQAETRSFFVLICGGDAPYTYVGVAKNGRGNITLPLQSYNPSGGPEASRFVALNRNTRYVLTRKDLTVTQGRRTLVKEKITRWY